MGSLREIRNKLNSIKNIAKITQAMEMVAASRLRKAQAKAEMSRPYARKLKEILDNLNMDTHDFVHPLVQARPVGKVGLIVIAADRGLCGGYNQTIFSHTEKFLKAYSPDQVELILVGRKAIDYFANKKWKKGLKLSDWGGKITYAQVEDFTNKVMQKYLDHELDEIWIIYTHYINIASRKIVISKFLNIEIENPEQIPKTSFIFEPNPKEIFAKILPHYCITKMQSALSEAYASELSARIFSMRAATKNAEEMIEELTLIRNKIRQAGITRELIEITTCVENLK